MQTSPEIDKLMAALAKAQGTIEAVTKNREVEVVSQRTNSRYSFKYATLDAIREAIRKPLSDNGLALVQSVDDGEGQSSVLTTMLGHESGQWISSKLKLMVENAGNQARGSAISYGRRYAICSLLGIVSEDDDDGNIVDANEFKAKGRKKIGGGMMTDLERQEAQQISDQQQRERGANGQPPLQKGTNGKTSLPPAEAAKKFADDAIQMFNSTKAEKECDDWWSKHKAYMEGLEERWPAQYERVCTASDNAYAALRGSPVA
jgi:hypothetical protein